jgi:hypothetical protein
MPRGPITGSNRASPRNWSPRGVGEGGFAVFKPIVFGELIGREVAKAGTPDLEWREGQLTAPFWVRKPSAKRLNDERSKALKKEREGDIFAWLRFKEQHSNLSKSEAFAKVARKWNLSSATLHRIVYGKAATITWRTHRELRRVLEPKGLWRKVERVLFSPQQLDFFHYLEGERSRYRTGRTRQNDYRPTQAIQREMKRFERLSVRLGMPAWRVDLANLRVFDPLIAHFALRKKRLLDHQETLKLVRLGYRRETMLVRAEVSLLNNR